MTAKPPASKPSSAIRAFIDVGYLPSSLYGLGQAKITRRLVHLILAKHANPDGTAIYPSQQTLAEECAGLTEYTLERTIKWLEDHRLVRRLPDPHPELRTIQYELLWPEAPEVEKGKQESADRHASKREATRRRTEKWRLRKKQPETVTQTVSVTSGAGDANLQRSVTQPCDAVTLGCDAVTQVGDACDAENPAFSPSTVLFNRPSRPSFEPSNLPSVNSDGRKDGSPPPSESLSRASNSLERRASWMSDFVYASTGARHSLSRNDLQELETISAEIDPAVFAVAFYKFCSRPKGLGGLNDVFGMFWREWPSHRKDAEDELQFGAENERSVREVLEDLHSDQFTYERVARENARSLPSMHVLTTALELTEQVCTETVQ